MTGVGVPLGTAGGVNVPARFAGSHSKGTGVIDGDQFRRCVWGATEHPTPHCCVQATSYPSAPQIGVEADSRMVHPSSGGANNDCTILDVGDLNGGEDR